VGGIAVTRRFVAQPVAKPGGLAAVLPGDGDGESERAAIAITIGLTSDPSVRRFLQGRQAVLPRSVEKGVGDMLTSGRLVV
jgi:hypothetical protein